jgi:hypothetical protein
MKPIPYKMEKNVPIPGRSHYTHWGFDNFEVGDSCLMAGDFATIRSALSYFAKRHRPLKFITRKTPEGLRVWRVR